MRTITNAELVEANRAAYKANRLVAQNLDLLPQGRDPCIYQGPHNTACGIGVALTDAELGMIAELGLNESTSVHDLQAYPSIGVQFEDLAFAQNLQGAHDAWATGHLSVYQDDADATDPVEQYRTLIGL